MVLAFRSENDWAFHPDGLSITYNKTGRKISPKLDFTIMFVLQQHCLSLGSIEKMFPKWCSLLWQGRKKVCAMSSGNTVAFECHAFDNITHCYLIPFVLLLSTDASCVMHSTVIFLLPIWYPLENSVGSSIIPYGVLGDTSGIPRISIWLKL